MEDNLIVCRELSKRFGMKYALDHVDLSIGRGRIVGLLGPNESGQLVHKKRREKSRLEDYIRNFVVFHMDFLYDRAPEPLLFVAF